MRFSKINLTVILLAYSVCSYAGSIDPATKAASHMAGIMFGPFGLSVSAIVIGATFVMAQSGKISWDRFVFVGLCTAGFLGSEKIVGLISSWVR